LTPQKFFEQADCHLKPSTLFGIGLLLAVAGATAVYPFRGPRSPVPGAGLGMFTLPLILPWNKRGMRLVAVAAPPADPVELVARALRAGHSLGAGMHVVAEEMPPPINEEFSRVYEEQNLGISVEDTLKNMCERVPNLDLRFFVTSVGIQRQTGGDLAEIL